MELLLSKKSGGVSGHLVESCKMSQSMGYNQAAGLGGMLKSGTTLAEGVDEAVLRNIAWTRRTYDKRTAVTRLSLAILKRVSFVLLSVCRNAFSRNARAC